MKNILGRIWAIWGILWFVATMILFYPWFLYCRFFLKEPRRTQYFIASSRWWMDIYLPLVGCPMKVLGKEHFQPGENYVVVCNHQSFMDVPVTSPGIPGTNKTIAKAEFSKIPLFGLIYQLGSVLVDRKSELSRKESFLKMKSVLASGMHMCIYPEGTRNKSNQVLQPFKDGAFRLAIESGKKIIPAVLMGTGKAMPPGKVFYLWPTALTMRFFPPMEPLPQEQPKDFRDRVYTAMLGYVNAAKIQ